MRAHEMLLVPQEAIFNISDAGGNAIRLWLHVDGAINPTFDKPTNGMPGLVTGLDPAVVQDLKWFLAECNSNGIKVLLSLWSHDILAMKRSDAGRKPA